MDVFSLYSYGKRCASKWLILCIIFSCADTEIYFRRLLPKRKVIWQMNHTAMNNSIWTTNSQSLSDFEFSHFCRYFPFLFDSCGHILLSLLSSLGISSGCLISHAYLAGLGCEFLEEIFQQTRVGTCIRHNLNRASYIWIRNQRIAGLLVKFSSPR